MYPGSVEKWLSHVLFARTRGGASSVEQFEFQHVPS
jgi:hypothetical protein